jgi:hypothetical protein
MDSRELIDLKTQRLLHQLEIPDLQERRNAAKSQPLSDKLRNATSKITQNYSLLSLIVGLLTFFILLMLKPPMVMSKPAGILERPTFSVTSALIWSALVTGGMIAAPHIYNAWQDRKSK